MKKFKKFIFVFVLIVLLTGCNSTQNTTKESEKVEDEIVLQTISNQVITLEQLPKTLELYKKGEAKIDDYTNEDKLRYSIDAVTSSRVVENNVSQEKKNELAAKGITNVNAFIPSDELGEQITSVFGISTINYDNISGCPNYIYVEADKGYYSQELPDCNEQTSEDKLISKIGNVTVIDNVYTAEFYVGVISNNTVYSDFNKTKVVKALGDSETYTISDEDKSKFSKVTYKFKKDSNSNLNLVSFKIA